MVVVGATQAGVVVVGSGVQAGVVGVGSVKKERVDRNRERRSLPREKNFERELLTRSRLLRSVGEFPRTVDLRLRRRRPSQNEARRSDDLERDATRHSSVMRGEEAEQIRREIQSSVRATWAGILQRRENMKRRVSERRKRGAEEERRRSREFRAERTSMVATAVFPLAVIAT